MGRPLRTEADKALMRAMGERLRWVREAYGKNQAEMADIVGVSQAAWHYYEVGKRWPDQFEAVRLIAKLKISRAYLLDGNLQDVDKSLAIQLAGRHPELAIATDTDHRRDRLLA
jgi:transcriptional regulator with XRE-family HTH domain